MNLPIGELAKRTGVNQRRYGMDEVRRLNFIRHARELGFEVEDIRELLGMSAMPQASCHQADSIARNHLSEIDRRIASLTALRGELSPRCWPITASAPPSTCTRRRDACSCRSRAAGRRAPRI